MIELGEPKKVDTAINNQSLPANADNVATQPAEARQVSKAGRDYYFKLRNYAGKMKQNPTPAEKIILNYLKSRNIVFKQQQVILPYIVDFLLPTKRMIIELDGKHHSENLNQFTYDTRRDELLMSMGITVIRFDNNKVDIGVIDSIFKKIVDMPTQKIFTRIGKHNQRYSCIGFNYFSVKHIIKYFRKNLWWEVDKLLRRRRANEQKGKIGYFETATPCMGIKTCGQSGACYTGGQ